MPDKATVTRKQLIDKLNEDLSREYQAIIAYVVYSQVLKGAAVHEHREGAREARGRGVAARADASRSTSTISAACRPTRRSR